MRLAGFSGEGLGLNVWGLGFRVLGFWGFGFRVLGLGFRVQGLGFWVLGFRVYTNCLGFRSGVLCGFWAGFAFLLLPKQFVFILGLWV